MEPSYSFYLRLWIMIGIISIFSGISAGILMLILKVVAQSVWRYSHGYLIDAIGDDGVYYRLAVFMINGIIVGVLKLVLTVFLPGPTSLTQLIWKDSDINLFSSIFQAIISIVSIALGCSLGRESAPQLVGAAIANEIFKKAVQYKIVDQEYKLLLVSIGAGSSFAAVYQLPFGGTLFTLEIWQAKLGFQESMFTFSGCAIATIVGMYMDLSLPYSATLTANVPDLLLPSIFIGLICGIWMSGITKCIQLLEDYRPKSNWQIVFYPIFALTILGAVCIPYPQLAGNGANISEILFTDGVSLSLLVPIMVLKPLVTLLCLGSGIPGGLFTPVFSCGALLGAFLGYLWSNVFPNVNVPSCAFIGAIATTSASIHGPLSAVGLTFELLQNFSIATPAIISMLLSLTVSRMLNCPSTYKARNH